LGAINREPTPPGPITDLFARLDELHSRAGRPSMREIAIRAGHGNVSSSTVHNIFRSARVPRWSFLDHVVQALGGAEDRAEFLALWQAAWRVENEPERQPKGGRVAAQVHKTVALSGITDRTEPLSASQRIRSPEIPPRNEYFTGRETELELLHDNLSRREGPYVQVLVGMGGIGKTELATEYVHRYIRDYEVIWWIRAEHHDRVRDALVRLAQRLGVRQATIDADRDRTIAVVLERLQSEIQSPWLLVYDNAANPLDLQRYLPAGRPGSHVIITSRLMNWPPYIAADATEVLPFTEDEAVSYLRGRVPGLAVRSRLLELSPDEDARRVAEATRLAAELGHLPLAVGHAAAYLRETGVSVNEYLTRFTQNAHLLLSEESGESDLPGPVSGTWAMSTALLTPDAEHLFNLCAFFSPEPVSGELLRQGPAGITEPPGLPELLASLMRFDAAQQQLGRLSLARVDGAKDLIQMHRVVQAVTRGRLRHDRQGMFYAYRAAVEALLAASNPGNPDDASGDAVYDSSLQHLEADYRFLHTDNAALRRLVIDQVRRLHLRGAHVEAMRFGEDALHVWHDRLGADAIEVLTLSVEVAIAMYVGGRAADAHELIMRIRPPLRSYTDGDGFKVLLSCENFYGEDLRAHSQFHEALELDREILPKFVATFGADHERTLNVRNNIAIDYRQLGRFQAALEVDLSLLEFHRNILGPNGLSTLHSASTVARDLRGLGRYQESLALSRRVAKAFAALDGRESIHWLYASEGFATALRKAGHHWDALQESEHVLQRYRDYLGTDHTYTLRAAANLINARRAVGDLAGAGELATETREACRRASRPADLVPAVTVNLASVLRAAARPAEALEEDEQARREFIRLYGEQHPLALAASINYASDLAACGTLGEAIQVGYETLAKCRVTLGSTHPDTLMAAANLTIDEAAAGNQAEADRRRAEVLQGYAETLTLEHPEARAANHGLRLTAEIEIEPHV
jgi:tetratricopeptide (TPR) repeat protein